MTAEVVPYAGWQKCVRLRNAEVDLVMTTDVGPRVIRFGFTGGPNEFVEYPDQVGQTGGTAYRSYGGHRLWISPEVAGRTNHPDNNPVGWKEENGEVTLIAPVEKETSLQKQLRVVLDKDRNHVRVIHKITNCSSSDATLAPWAVSVLAPGGRAIVPQEPFVAHADRVLPVRPVVLWGYTQMKDPRWTWGNRFIVLRQDSAVEVPQKMGALVSEGWAAYANGDRLFVKRFPFVQGADYPDFGCNLELFTNNRMLEVESLGPLSTLKKGESVSHQEDWYLLRGIKIGASDEAIASAFASVLSALS